MDYASIFVDKHIALNLNGVYLLFLTFFVLSSALVLFLVYDAVLTRGGGEAMPRNSADSGESLVPGDTRNTQMRRYYYIL